MIVTIVKTPYSIDTPMGVITTNGLYMEHAYRFRQHGYVETNIWELAEDGESKGARNISDFFYSSVREYNMLEVLVNKNTPILAPIEATPTDTFMTWLSKVIKQFVMIKTNKAESEVITTYMPQEQ